jgi:hypothetical protein
MVTMGGICNSGASLAPDGRWATLLHSTQIEEMGCPDREDSYKGYWGVIGFLPYKALLQHSEWLRRRQGSVRGVALVRGTYV